MSYLDNLINVIEPTNLSSIPTEAKSNGSMFLLSLTRARNLSRSLS